MTRTTRLSFLAAGTLAAAIGSPSALRAQDAAGTTRTPPEVSVAPSAVDSVVRADDVEPDANDAATPGDQATVTKDVAGMALYDADDDRIKEHFAPVIARPGGLTSDEAASDAARVAPATKSAQARVDSADAAVDEVIWSYTPRLTAVASYTRLSPQPTPSGNTGTGGNIVATTAPAGIIDPATDPLIALDLANAFAQIPDQWMLTAGLTVPFTDYILNLSNAISGANQGLESSRLNLQAEQVNAAANARLAYYRWVQAKLTAREATKSVERAEKQLEVIKAQQAAGRMSRADVLRSDAFLASMELNLRRANTQEAIAREQLNVMMTGGFKAQPDWEIGENILEDPAQLETKTLSELQDEALTERLEVRALGKRAGALRRKAAVERTQAWPRVEGFANVMYANPNPRVQPQSEEWIGSWDIGVQAVWTLNELGMKYARARQSEAEASEVDAQVEQIEFLLRQEVLSEYRTLEEATLAKNSAYRGWQAAEAAYKDRVVLFENGRATSLDLLEAETSLVQARLDLVSAYIAQRTARVRLDHALGRDIAGVIGN